MAIKLNQGLKQTQSLVMTPQLQQAIKLLTLTHLEMTSVIANEMIENPMLEEIDGEMTPEVQKKEVDHKLERLEGQNEEARAENFDGPELATGKDEFDWNSYIETYNSHSSSPPTMAKNDNEDTPNYENMVSKGMSLPEHLEWQLRMENLTESEWQVANLIIHNINDDGYLDIDMEEVISETNHNREDSFEILEMIKGLDPIGCGARSLKECLMAQIKVLDQRLPLVEKIVDEFLDDLQKRDFSGIAKKIGVDKEKIKEASEIIMSLNPKPGRLVSPEETQYIVPDIYIHEVGGEFQVKLNDEGVPRLRISKLYRDLLSEGKQEDDVAKEYVQDKMRSALSLIKGIQNRQKTIVKVTEAILKYQPEFFRKGAQHLRPMILKDIAAEIGMHESTVSRVTTNKYMHSPLGVFELKYFFNSGLGGKSGGIDVASESLKIKIKKLIESENKKRPLSDQKIVNILKQDNINVARRTVAKYRELMNISPSSKRKRLD